MELTKDEKQLLTEIVNDKFSVGAFSGMIFNGLIQYKKDEAFAEASTTEITDKLIKTALRTRLRMKELVK